MDGVDYRIYNWRVSTNTMGSELFFFIIIYIKRDRRFYGYLDRIQDRQIYLIRNLMKQGLIKNPFKSKDLSIQSSPGEGKPAGFLTRKRGCLMAYVYLPNGTMLNALLIQEGQAQVMTVPPNLKFQDLFLKLHKEARERGKGLQ